MYYNIYIIIAQQYLPLTLQSVIIRQIPPFSMFHWIMFLLEDLFIIHSNNLKTLSASKLSLMFSSFFIFYCDSISVEKRTSSLSSIAFITTHSTVTIHIITCPHCGFSDYISTHEFMLFVIQSQIEFKASCLNIQSKL